MDFTENHEFFSRPRCVKFNFHYWRETNHAVKLRGKFHAVKLGVKLISRRETRVKFHKVKIIFTP